MYKLLLVTDQDTVLETYDRIENWGFNGFRRPHIRRDVEGAKEGLQKHHIDGIIPALKNPEDNEALLVCLREDWPMLSIVEPGNTPEEVTRNLGELLQALNYIRADFSSDTYDEHTAMIRARRRLFRRLVSGKGMTREELTRQMLLLRSRMDPDMPCILMDLEQYALEGEQVLGRIQDSEHLLEKELFFSFGGDLDYMHVLPLVIQDGRIFVLGGTLRGRDASGDMAEELSRCVAEGIEHAGEYRGLHLRISGVREVPSLYDFCTDEAE